MPYSMRLDGPSERVRRAIASVRAAGIPVTVATGRAVWNALHAVRQLGLEDGVPVVCSNGALLYDVAAERVAHRVPFDPAPAVHALLEVNPGVGIAVEYRTEGWRYNGSFKPDFESRFVGMVDVPTLVAEPTTRLVVRLPGDDTDVPSWPSLRREAYELVEVAGLARLGCDMEVGVFGWIDVCAAGVSKATGAAMVADDLGVPAADVVAVGDGNNDLPMFAWAGHAVAMGQATDRVRNAADEVIPSVDEDGVAQLLERWA